MKNRIVPVIAITVAGAFAAAPSFAQPRPYTSTSFALHAFQDEKPPEKPPEKPAKPKPQEPDAKPGNPPAHEPDKKPAEKPAEKPKKPAQSPDARDNSPEKPAKPPKQEKQDAKNQNNERANKNAGNEQNKKSVHAEQHVHYSFRSQDKTTLRQHFETQIRSVNRSDRPHVVVGGFIPQEQVTYIQTVPVEVISLLPPIPEGCVVGFWDGFIVVYYPDDFYVVSYIDLL